jgi:prepilin-type N-terminal cleavage/methylation domain-containing protein
MRHQHNKKQLQLPKSWAPAIIKAGGFTLQELMITITIIGILSSIAIPSGINMLRREELRKAILEAIGFLQSARQTAMTQSLRCGVEIDNTGTMRVQEFDKDGTAITSSITSNKCINTPAFPSGTLDLRGYTGDNSITTTIAPSDKKIIFSMHGTALFASDIEIKTNSSNASNYTRCILITAPLGFIKTATASSSTTSCQYVRSN